MSVKMCFETDCVCSSAEEYTREDEHPENNAKDARNNALLRLFVLLVVCLFNKKSGMVFKLLLLLMQEY